jgi:uncharacterized protein YndB with AHSA1/START domain
MTTRTPVSVTKDISASPESIWALVTDLPRMGEWSPENRGGEWLKGATGPSVGARFKGKVYEIEPTATGSRVTHSWIDRRGKFSTWLGGKLSNVDDRAVHNLKNMTATLDAIAVTATSRA